VIKLSGDLVDSHVNNKRATFNECLPTMESQLYAAAASAQSLSFNAYAYVGAISSGTYWYTRWFGAYDASRIATVRSVFELISNGDFSSYSYDCSCPCPTLAFICPYIFQSRDCYSVTDNYLNQFLTNPERSGSAIASGMPPTLARIPGPERLSRWLPAGTTTAVPSTTLPVSQIP
jgi:hypothetical protein